ncbi:hypothetical protein [Gloeothece verrucosa]|uniref:HepT-like domain-containing protein n=1 Tax=Gloeothece verrucosa (strain PCC 7822) TaxID=497965 RepID=E0UMV1_GLOV7|nr:hypothetical protein [Gloeothece verrucosa]ADN18281.1 conserved hypothetical protein [Gloeothece verrucosa PCC 7822]
MIESYRVLANRIRFELNQLEQLIIRCERGMKAYQNTSENRDLFLDSVALSLHDLYTGLELIFSKIATGVDGHMPAGQEWHRDLLIQMSLDIAQTRPKVISISTREALDEYRRFRHVVRNVYSFNLDAKRLEPLIERSRPIFTQIQQELFSFADLLEQIAQ